MAHPEQQFFCQQVRFFRPEHFRNKRVLDVGSQDVNGNNRGLFEGGEYLGIDVGAGPNVDVVCPAHLFSDPQGFDTVVSTECFEHDEHWQSTLWNIATRLLLPGGLFFFTCAAPGRPEHGTRRSSPESSPFTTDYYRNLSASDIRSVLPVEVLFVEHGFQERQGWPQDLYFWGVKR